MKMAVLAGLSALIFHPVFAGSLSLQVEPGGKPDVYVVSLKNPGTNALAVVGRKTRTDSFVPMTFTLRGSLLPSTRTSEEIAPYLVLQMRLASGERMLLVHPPEMAKFGTLEAAYEDARFIFSPAQEYLFQITLPQPPVLAEVHLVDVAERSAMMRARWRARE